jgi:hypothetical protein
MIPPARRALDKEASTVKGAQFKASNLALMKFTCIVSAAVLPLAVLGATSYFYLRRNTSLTEPLSSAESDIILGGK